METRFLHRSLPPETLPWELHIPAWASSTAEEIGKQGSGCAQEPVGVLAQWQEENKARPSVAIQGVRGSTQEYRVKLVFIFKSSMVSF